jgi:hypothetical protein
MASRSFSLYVAFVAIASTTTVAAEVKEVSSSKLQVQLPQSLKRDGGYDHREALFGMPPYGGSIEQKVYYADADLCDSAMDYSRGGFPTRPVDESGDMMESWKAPFILMVDRGVCTFVKKARNAQKLGAAAMIIADSTCLCAYKDTCKSDDNAAAICEANEPIMADDGSGADVTIPSYLMFKQDADPIKEQLKKNVNVRMKMSWAIPQPDSVVNYSLWTSPSEILSRSIQKEFRHIAKALGEHAKFTPHMFVYDGVVAGCQSEGQNQCYTMCTNNGKYCATDPDDDLDEGISGADVVKESLRRLCIWKEYGADGVGMEWWDYVNEFLYRCDTDDYFMNESCVKDCMDRSGVEYEKIELCMQDAGGLEGDVANTILDKEISAKEVEGVVILPSLFVNNAPLRGAPKSAELFEAICAGFADGYEPHTCKKCNGCDDLAKCVSTGHCPGAVDSMDTVSFPVFVGTLAGVILCFGIGGIVQWQRSQRQMRTQVRGIMAEYMPIDSKTTVESVGIPDDDDYDDLHVEIS